MTTARIHKMLDLARALEEEAARLEALLPRTPAKHYANRRQLIDSQRQDAAYWREKAKELKGAQNATH